MPRNKSAQKSARSSEKKRLRNRSTKSAIKTYTIKAEKLILNNNLEQAQEAVTLTIKTLDKAIKKGVIHSNTASRRKSNLTKKLNKAMLSQTAEPEITATDTEPIQE